MATPSKGARAAGMRWTTDGRYRRQRATHTHVVRGCVRLFGPPERLGKIESRLLISVWTGGRSRTEVAPSWPRGGMECVTARPALMTAPQISDSSPSRRPWTTTPTTCLGKKQPWM